MRHRSSLLVLGAAGLLLSFATAASAAHNPADYPLRVHINDLQSHSHYHYRVLDYVDGEGRANLFEQGEPRGFDFSFRCDQRFRGSVGFETYMARWKKPGKQLEILLPVMGKPGATDGCALQVSMKESVYVRRNGQLYEEPPAAFKDWMAKHQYDPEHGKNEPVFAAREPATGGEPAPPPPAADRPQ